MMSKVAGIAALVVGWWIMEMPLQTFKHSSGCNVSGPFSFWTAARAGVMDVLQLVREPC